MSVLWQPVRSANYVGQSEQSKITFGHLLKQCEQSALKITYERESDRNPICLQSEMSIDQLDKAHIYFPGMLNLKIKG